MTTSNINKIVRSNLNLKPWILSKNTSEIVNSYIQKFYKQSPKTLKNDLLQSSKMAATKPENKGPIRSLKTRDRMRTPSSTDAITTTPTAATAAAATQAARLKGCAPPVVAAAATATHAGGAEQILGAVINRTNKRSAVANLAANRKFLKSPNYKIYGSRRFGSSASSSSASIFRRYEDRRRHRNTTGAELNYLLRSIGTYPSSKLANLGLSNAVFKYVTPVRNQHMAARSANNPAAIEVSSAIQRDLMLIDAALKDRIALGRTRTVKERVVGLVEDRQGGDPMKGWHHPPSPELFFSRADEQEVAFAELAEQNRRLRTANKLKQFNYMRPGLWPAMPGFDKKSSRPQLAEKTNSINKNQSIHITPRSVHSRIAHHVPRHPPAKNSNPYIPAMKSNETNVVKVKKTDVQCNTTFNSENSGTMATSNSSVASTPAQKSSGNGITSTATSILAAAALATAQSPYNVGRFNRSNFNQNRKY